MAKKSALPTQAPEATTTSTSVPAELAGKLPVVYLDKFEKCSTCGKWHRVDIDTRGTTCHAHLGKVGQEYVPAETAKGLVPLTELCKIGELHGVSAGWVARLTGGDAGVKPPKREEYRITSCRSEEWQSMSTGRYIAVRKWLDPKCLAIFAKDLGLPAEVINQVAHEKDVRTALEIMRNA